MVSLLDVVASNRKIASAFPNGLVAVFVGGTSGVGEYTVKAFAKYTRDSRAYIVGRSADAGDRIVKECYQLNPDGVYKFIQSDISLLRNVDSVCNRIKQQESSVNILFLTQGSMADDLTTSEGLPFAAALVMHSRMRFIYNLLPLLHKAQSLRRVVSVLAATCEGPIDTSNMAANGFPLMKRRDQMASMQTLLLEEAAGHAPDVSFIHDVPGVVKSGITRDAKGLGLSIMIFVSRLLGPLIETSPEECGERHIFFATSALYPPLRDSAATSGVLWTGNPDRARGSNGQGGSGIYTIDNKGESSPQKVEQLLADFRDNGTAEAVCKYVATDIERVMTTKLVQQPAEGTFECATVE